MDNHSIPNTPETQIKRIINNPESLLPVPHSFLENLKEIIDLDMISDDDPRKIPLLESARVYMESVTEDGEQAGGLNVLTHKAGQIAVALLVHLGAGRAIATAQFDFNDGVAADDPGLIMPLQRSCRPKENG